MWILKISGYSILVPLICGIVYFKYLNNVHKKFLWFILFSTFFEAAVAYVGNRYGNNLWMFKVFLVCDFVFFVWFFNQIHKNSLIDWLIVAFVILFIAVDYFVLQRYSSINLNLSLFHLIFFLFFIFQSSYIIMKVFDNFGGNLFNDFVFWIAFARLFYFLIIMFIFIYPNFISKNLNNRSLYEYVDATINSVANILLNLLYAVSFVCRRKITQY
jgi:hypothetical protein